MDRLQGFGKNITYASNYRWRNLCSTDRFRGAFSGVGATITPFAQRTQQFVRESLGQSEDKVRLTYTSLADNGC